MRRVCSLLFAALVLLPAGGTAQRTLVLESFDAVIHVQPNGDVEVTETLRARFQGSWNGIYRNLSLAHQTAEGRAERLDVDLVSITDEAGNRLRHEASSQGRMARRFQIWVPGAEDATRTVVIRYVVHNAIRFFGEESAFGHKDELYWNVTGNEWEVPIERASARIVLPQGATATESAGYTGPAGATGRDVRIQDGGGEVVFTSTRRLEPGEGLTAAVAWPPGLVARPSRASGATRTATERWPGVLPLLAFFFGLRQWRRKGRDPDARSIAVQYEPPEELAPTEVGTLVDHKAEMHDVTATLVDLAVRGFIHIEQRVSKTLGLFKKTEYVFHLKKPRGEWDGLSTHERLYLEAIFRHEGAKSALAAFKAFLGGDEEPPSPGDVVEGAGPGPTYGSVPLSALQNEFYKDLDKIKKAVYEQLVAKGHYERDPESAKRGLSFGGLALIAGGVGGAVWISNTAALPVHPLWLGGGLGLSGLILLLFGQVMPARTVLGARSREEALGFKEFLARVEEDRFRRMITSPDLFERYLPFAMAFKVEKKWAKAFETMFTEPPGWYTGPSGTRFHASSFTQEISDLSSAAATTMASSPSGSGGGGSSGGGSGGGGGGGF